MGGGIALLGQAEVGWTSSEGFFYTLGVVSSSGNTSTPDLKDFSADLAVALAPCVSLDLNLRS